jgi:bacilliredoxin
MYPELMVMPMREELTRLGIKETRTAEDVDQALKQPGTTMVVVNSICGCAAGKMRPAVRAALQNATRPDHTITVFAGQDRDATERAREYFRGYPPSSPSIGLLRDGDLVYMMQRSDIETSDPQTIASKLAQAFNQYCSKSAVS